MCLSPSQDCLMPASETPTNPSSTEQSERAPELVAVAEPDGKSAQIEPESERTSAPLLRSSSRYIDYDTHELLEKITQYEDERRWQRIREGIWISILLHIVLFSSLSWIPRYIFHSPQVIDPFDAIKKRKDLTYLDELPDALKQIQKAKPKLPPLKQSETVVDKKTLDALKALEKAKPKPTPAPEQAQTPPPPQPAVQLPQPEQPAPLPPTTAAPQPAPQLPLDTPRPAPVPARPNFSMSQQSAADQLKNAMRDSAHGPSGAGGGPGQRDSPAATAVGDFEALPAGLSGPTWKAIRDTPVIAKIETPDAVENLESIVAASDGVMVARGDLGVEFPPERVPVIQRQILGDGAARAAPGHRRDRDAPVDDQVDAPDARRGERRRQRRLLGHRLPHAQRRDGDRRPPARSRAR